jgi:hypothetical protein
MSICRWTAAGLNEECSLASRRLGRAPCQTGQHGRRRARPPVTTQRWGLVRQPFSYSTLVNRQDLALQRLPLE